MRYSLISAMVAVVIATSGCSHYGGETGLWGGTWHLEEIITGDRVNVDYIGNVFWKFQDDVVDMVETDDEMHERKDHYGTWSASDDNRVLTLDFSHSSDRFPAGSEDYVPPKVTGLKGGVTRLEVERLTSREMVVKTEVIEDNNEIRFVLNKQ